MPRVFVSVFLLALVFTGCSTSEVYRPADTEASPKVSTDEQTATVVSGGIHLEAKSAREDNGRIRVDLVVDNHSDQAIDLVLGDVRLFYNGVELKPYSTRFLRNWSYQSATRGTFAPGESAYATVAYQNTEAAGAGLVNIEILVNGISDARSGSKIELPKLHFGPGLKEAPASSAAAPSPGEKLRSKTK